MRLFSSTLVMLGALALTGRFVRSNRLVTRSDRPASRPWRRIFRRVLAICSLAVVAPAAALGGQQLHGHVPAAVARLQPVDHPPVAQHLHLAIGLPARNPDGLKSLIDDLYNPASPNFRHYLTPAQFTEQFGPTPQDYQAVVDFAVANGLKVTATHPNRLVLDVDGAIPEIEKTFHVRMRNYQHPREGRKFYAPDAEPSLDLATPVLHISGLDNYSLPHPNYKIKPLEAAVSATPKAGSAPNGSSYGGGDFRAAYVPGTALTGAGQSVALLQFDGYYASDIAAYKTQFGLPNVPLVNVAVSGGVSTPGTGNPEVCLDIEMALSMAPGVSTIYVYEAPNPSPWATLLSKIATDNLAKQIGCSWGGGGVDPTSETIFKQMAAQGQSFFNATGDSDAFTGTVPFPSDSPNITEVGATTLTTTGALGSYVSEKAWNWGLNGTSYSGSSGGSSTYYAIPSWQSGTSMATNQGSTTMRNVPDVAMTGDNVYVLCNNGGSMVLGGTSCAAPLWAGFTALVNQQAAAAGRATVGFINPAIYAIGNGANFTSDFRDTTTGNNFWPSSPTKFAAVAGYDLCTGWGTPNGTALINALAVPFIVTTTSPLPTGTVGVAYSQTLAAGGGTEPYTWAISAGSLPAGLSLSSGGVLSGTPTAATTASFTVQATGSDALFVTKVFSLAISPHFTIPFTEGFENIGAIPAYWAQEYVTTSPTTSWTFRTGGQSTRRPTTAHGGTYNAFLYNTSTSDHVTKLVTPPIDFGSNTVNTQLTFWHFMQVRTTAQDQLKVYYKTSAGGAWTLLATYAASVTAWTQQTVSLPNPGGSYYIAFEGNAKGGYGVCVDDVQVTGSSTKAAATVVLANLTPTYDGTPKPATATTTPAGLTVGLTYNGSATAPANAGSYAVVATVSDANYQGSAGGTLVIGKATATVVLNSLSPTYDGAAKAAGATTTPAGPTVGLTYNGSASAPANAGSYAVVATVSDPNYQGSAGGTLVIGKATATVVLNSLSQAYDGVAKAAGATTIPGGLTVGLTYYGSAAAPTDVGSYAVVATVSDPNYQGSSAGTLVIQKATATVALGTLAWTYDGTPKAASATTTPGGLAVGLTYDGSATVPTHAGSYAVVAAISDPNYQGASSGTLVIQKAAAAVELNALAQTYDGVEKPASATTTPSGLAVGLTYDGLATVPTNSGSYAVVATVNDPNYQGASAGTLVIQQAAASVALGALTPTYDGSAKSAVATTTPLGLAVVLTYDGSATAPIHAGSYTVAAAIHDPNYQGSASGTLVIRKAAAGMVLTALTQTYDGTAKPAGVTTTPAGLSVGLTYDGSASAPVLAGSYAVVATVNDADYQGSASGTLVIDKAAAAVALSAPAQTYDGSPKTAGATTTPPGLVVNLTYDASASAPTDAGSYAVVATVNDANYQGAASATLVIGKAEASVVLDSLAQIYDATPRLAGATTTPADLAVDIDYDGSETAPTAAGSYAVAATINDTNYQGSASGTLVIGKAAATVVLGSLAQLYDGAAKPAVATSTPAGLTLILTYDGAASAPASIGSYAVVASVNDANYQGSAGGTLVIGATMDLAIWRDLHFSASEQSAGLAADAADPDGDGLTNLAEYALGRDPRAFSAPLVPTRDGDGLSILFTRPANLLDVSYGAESSDDLTHWSPVPLEVLVTGPVETVRARDPLTTGDPFRRMLRLRFERQ